MAPSSQGLYNPAFEHDACGVAMVADMHGRRSRDIVDKAITALVNLEHRGAQGAEPNTGDGAGHPAPGSRRVPAGSRRIRAARIRQLRHRHRLPAAVVQGRGRGVRVRREDRRGRGPRGAGLARRADRRLISWARWPATRCRHSASCSSPAPRGWTLSAALTSYVSAPNTSSAPRALARTGRAARPFISQAFPVRRSSTRAC